MEHLEFQRTMDIGAQTYAYFDITQLEKKGIADIHRLPYAIKILVENLLRKMDGKIVAEADLLNIAKWQKAYGKPVEIPHHPARVLMQDFTGVPAVVDLAAMRDAVKELGGNPESINPLVPVELIVDHSIQVDYFGTADALEKNVIKEYDRNRERYELLKWAQKNFDNFKVVPPNSGICHQVNLEYLGRVVIAEPTDSGLLAYPDTLVGTDSHTTMINSLGIMGWGVGGIEAEAVMLGQPYYMSIPEVIGVRLTGSLKAGVTATDLVLTVTEALRKMDAVEKFVEFFGPGMQSLQLADRATIANMSPEYGATMGFFPVDEQTLRYLRMTNRAEQADIVERYTKATDLFYSGDSEADYSDVLELDISTVEPSVAGPARPQDRIPLKDLKRSFHDMIAGSQASASSKIKAASRMDDNGCPNGSEEIGQVTAGASQGAFHEGEEAIQNGSIVIAAITSCTNTSNPYVMLGAGILAKKAVKKGLRVPAYVKTSLAPGSKVVMDYLNDAGLTPYLEALGFHLTAFGCTTCIGNSGPLHADIERAIREKDLTVAAVLSGNRNFEARIHQHVKANYLASPMLVILMALAGRIDKDVTREAIAKDPNGEEVFFDDIWPSQEELQKAVDAHIRTAFYEEEYGRIFQGDRFWEELTIAESTTFKWDEDSSYIKRPPYFEGFDLKLNKPTDIDGANALLVLGDSVTTDHISPAGAIPEAYPAGRYLLAQGVDGVDFNSYGSRRGNHEVMMRGTFGNIRIKNQLVAPKEGSHTLKFPDAGEMFVFDAAVQYLKEKKPLVVLGGTEYGTGSSRDWAAKGTHLLGIKAVIARSFERIHRSNLVGMGVLPLVFKKGDSWEGLGLTGAETFFLSGVEDMTPGKSIRVKALKANGDAVEFEAIVRLDTAVDVDYFEHGGILPFVLRRIMQTQKKL